MIERYLCMGAIDLTLVVIVYALVIKYGHLIKRGDA